MPTHHSRTSTWSHVPKNLFHFRSQGSTPTTEPRSANHHDVAGHRQWQADDSDGGAWQGRTAGSLRGCVIAVQEDDEPMVAVREAQSRCSRRRCRRPRPIREMCVASGSVLRLNTARCRCCGGRSGGGTTARSPRSGVNRWRSSRTGPRHPSRRDPTGCSHVTRVRSSTS